MGPHELQYILQQMITFIGITGLPNEWVQNSPQWHKEYFELKTSDYQQMQEEAFSKVPLLPKNRSSPKKNSIVLNSPPLEFYSQGRLPLTTGEERRRHHAQTDMDINISQLSSIFLRTHLSLINVTYSPLSSLSSPFLSIKMLYLLSNLTDTLGSHFFQWCSWIFKIKN